MSVLPFAEVGVIQTSNLILGELFRLGTCRNGMSARDFIGEQWHGIRPALKDRKPGWTVREGPCG